MKTKSEILNSLNEMMDLPFSQKGKMVGWIALYNGKKLEIRDGKDANSLSSAKEFALKHFKVPNSKKGLLAIAPAFANEERIVEGTIEIRELAIYIENDITVYGEYLRVAKKLQKQFNDGEYNHKKAIKAFLPVAEFAAKAYAKEYSLVSDSVFTKQDIKKAAVEVADSLKGELEAGNFLMEGNGLSMPRLKQMLKRIQKSHAKNEVKYLMDTAYDLDSNEMKDALLNVARTLGELENHILYFNRLQNN